MSIGGRCASKWWGIPEIPSLQGLQMQHLQTVFHAAAALCAFMEKAGFLGIVDEVVEQVRGSKGIVGQFRGFFHAWRHANGRSIDDDGVLREEFERRLT